MYKQSQKSRKEKEDEEEGKMASGAPGSDLGDLTPSADTSIRQSPGTHPTRETNKQDLNVPIFHA